MWGEQLPQDLKPLPRLKRCKSLKGTRQVLGGTRVAFGSEVRGHSGGARPALAGGCLFPKVLWRLWDLSPALRLPARPSSNPFIKSLSMGNYSSRRNRSFHLFLT